MTTTTQITEQPTSDQSSPLVRGPGTPQGLAEQAAVSEAQEICEALNELDRLAKATRTAVLGRNKYRALSSLVAISPLVSHIMDTCTKMSAATSSGQASARGTGSEGYL